MIKNAPLVFTAVSLAAFAPFQSAFAVDVFWSGGTDTSWNTGANWGGTAPTNNTTSDIAVFNGTTAYTNQPDLAAFTVQSVNGLRIGGTSAVAFTLSNSSGTKNTNGAVISGSNDIVMSDVTGLAVGQMVTGSRISRATFITAINGNTITLSQPTSGGTLNDASTLTFASSLRLGASGITLAADTPNVNNIITAPIVLAANQDWNANAARSLQIQGAIYLDNYTLTLKGITGSTLSFNGSSGTQSISGSGGIVIDTDGTVNFGPGSGGRQQNVFTGGVTLNKGLLTLSGGNSGGTDNAGALGTGVLTINGGSISGGGNIAGHALTVSGQVWNSDWSFTGNKSVDMGTGEISLGTTVGTSRTLTVNSGGNVLTLGGAIVNGTTANSFIKAGTSRVVLTGASTYTGSTTIQAGTIQINGADDRLPTGTTLTIDGGASAGGTFDLNGRNQTVAGLSGGSGTVKGVVTNTLAASTSTITVTGTSTFDGVIQDGAVDGITALTKSNGGTLTLGGANTYTGITTVSGGTLALAAANRIADTSNLVLAGGTFATGGFNETLGTLTVSASSIIDLGSGASALVFADSNAAIWGGSVSLSFINFTLNSDTIRFGGDANGLSSAQLAKITINGSAAGIDSQGYLTVSMIPEPSSISLLAGFGVMLIALRRRR
jgi:autotransporter-associated beta strand protein